MIILYVCEWPGEVLVSPVSPLPLFSPTLGLTCPSPSLQFSQFFVQNLPLPLLLLSYSNAGRKKQTILNIFGNGRNWSDRRLVGRVEWCDGGQECIKRRLLIPTTHPKCPPPSTAPPLHFLSCPSRPIRPLFPPSPFLFPRSLPSSSPLSLPLNIVRPSLEAQLLHPRYIFHLPVETCHHPCHLH